MSKLQSVLIVDDNERCLEVMSLAFESTGSVRVSCEQDPERAVDRIRKDAPDLVMLDVKMPKLNGFDVLTQIRGAGIRTPVVMCSGSNLQQDVNRAYETGCNGFMEKPTSLVAYQELAGSVVSYWRLSELPQG